MNNSIKTVAVVSAACTVLIQIAQLFRMARFYAGIIAEHGCWGMELTTKIFIHNSWIMLLASIMLIVWAIVVLRKQTSVLHASIFLVAMALLAAVIQYFSLFYFNMTSMGGLGGG